MKVGICSYSLHRTFEAGAMDAFSFIELCAELGCTQLDPLAHHIREALDDVDYRRRLQQAAGRVGLPFGCIAVDGADVYEREPAARERSRGLARRWLEALADLGAQQARIDAGDPAELTGDVLDLLVEGYGELIERGRALGIEILVENHRGALREPASVVRLLEATPGLGLLLDTNNWVSGSQQEGWEKTAPHARATHFKTFQFDERGIDPTVDLPLAVRLLQRAGYDGAWGIESTPRELDEVEAARKTMAWLRRVAG
jgi:sugar phosphate isomerase/epimerase